MRMLFSKMDKPLLLTMIAFFIFGLVMVLSASSMESYMRYGYDSYHYFYRQAVFIGIGSFLSVSVLAMGITGIALIKTLGSILIFVFAVVKSDEMKRLIKKA